MKKYRVEIKTSRWGMSRLELEAYAKASPFEISAAQYLAMAKTGKPMVSVPHDNERVETRITCEVESDDHELS